MCHNFWNDISASSLKPIERSATATQKEKRKREKEREGDTNRAHAFELVALVPRSIATTLPKRKCSAMRGKCGACCYLWQQNTYNIVINSTILITMIPITILITIIIMIISITMPITIVITLPGCLASFISSQRLRLSVYPSPSPSLSPSLSPVCVCEQSWMNSAKTQTEAQCEAIKPGEPLELQPKGGRGRGRKGDKKTKRNEWNNERAARRSEAKWSETPTKEIIKGRARTKRRDAKWVWQKTWQFFAWQHTATIRDETRPKRTLKAIIIIIIMYDDHHNDRACAQSL